MTRVLTEKESQILADLLDKAEQHGKAYLLPKSKDEPVVIIDFTERFKNTLKEAFILEGLNTDWGNE